jgi:type II secretory pathway component GspD/PulD (secretin)
MTRIAFVCAATIAIACAGCSSTSTSRTASSNASNGSSDTTTSMEVIPLQHIAADSAAVQLQSEHAGVKIVADPRTNAIIVAGSPAELEEIRQAVNRVDQPG